MSAVGVILWSLGQGHNVVTTDVSWEALTKEYAHHCIMYRSKVMDKVEV